MPRSAERIDAEAIGSGGVRFGVMEFAGAFGDLGTLVPFLVAYITLARVDPYGMLLGFGVAMIASGLFYRTPFPVQPMKAIGAVATTYATQGVALTNPNVVYAAGLASGLIWIGLGLTGLANRVARLMGRPVGQGIVLGLGLSFMLDGVEMAATGWLLGAAGVVLTLLLHRSQRIPAMLALLALGVLVTWLREPELLSRLRGMEIVFRAPSWTLGSLSWNDVVVGTIFLALPQVPLTLGNAVVATTTQNNRLFPHRPVTERKVAISTGVMNLIAPAFGGVPMCHGAGGMAGQVRFGARSGGAPIILGTLLLLLALLFSTSIETLMMLFPKPILGVILFFAGSELAVGAFDPEDVARGERFIFYTVAALTVWNVGVAFVFGAVVHALHQRGWLRL
ncbi:MAG: putative sulfate/molybdate transporter [Betaproteobacteria bacterium]|nr:putative sulfate/molybdate transporter [Betaproteobacteria bacterium]